MSEVSDERKKGREEMRKACIALINEAREEGESDMRSVRAWVEYCKLDDAGKLIDESDEDES